MTEANHNNLGRMIRQEDIPQIDLYMDQVIQLFEQVFGDTKRHDGDKIMTKTMINNYAKGGLLFPIHNKRYTKEHIMLIALIYELKGVLSMNDIKAALYAVTEQRKELPLGDIYHHYLAIADDNAIRFMADFESEWERVKGHAEEMQADGDVQQVLMILSCINQSNLYRRMAENLIDGLEDPDQRDL
ncbi:DUF1836 domain-containing protein [Salisediminibacterium beveridgei]|uniref:DUF1836 domain-containing protein n=1 Tax=Salisediminibacterium beveridgei TaxID=632773 RepID=A0A1D7QYX3_9BACI|nr:DUF1836 domain-containing protein [Salisediminibacterium beveridgei]AOM84207.1 hypothetical protein BBEV_2882 [Salisediminibacterium beveridgei]